MIIFTILGVLLFIVFIVLLLLFTRVELIVFLNNNEYDANLRVLKVIKINVNDKTKGESEKGGDFSKLRTFLAKENRENLKYLLSKSDMKVSGTLVYGAPTPDVTAVLYGTLHALLYIIDNFLQTTFKTYSRNYSINPDMKNKRLEYEVTIRVYTRIINYLVYKKRTKKYEEKIRGGVENGRAASN